MKPIKLFQSNHNLVTDGIIGPKTMRVFQEVHKIATIEQLAHHLGQVDHETGGFRYSEENLNYSAEGLLKVFRKYFTPEQAREYARQPERIANRVYANRMGNGDEASGDGSKFKGRGGLQTTGRYNYEILSREVKDPCVLETPDLVATKYYFQSGLIFFKNNNLWRLCNQVNDASIAAVTLRVNGGYHGLKDRVEKTKKYYDMLRG